MPTSPSADTKALSCATRLPSPRPLPCHSEATGSSCWCSCSLSFDITSAQRLLTSATAGLLLCRAAYNAPLRLLLHSQLPPRALLLRLASSRPLCPPPLHRCPPSTSPPSGWTRTGACAPRTSTTRRNVPKATISSRSPLAVAAALRRAAQTSWCAACATRRRCGSMRASGWCAAWLAAVGATPCAQRARVRSTARMQLMLEARISRWRYVARKPRCCRPVLLLHTRLRRV